MGFRTCINPRQRRPDSEVILTRDLGVNIRAVVKAALFLLSPQHWSQCRNTILNLRFITFSHTYHHANFPDSRTRICQMNNEEADRSRVTSVRFYNVA